MPTLPTSSSRLYFTDCYKSFPRGTLRNERNGCPRSQPRILDEDQKDFQTFRSSFAPAPLAAKPSRIQSVRGLAQMRQRAESISISLAKLREFLSGGGRHFLHQLEIIPMIFTTSPAMLPHSLAHFGILQTIVSDNGTQFTSAGSRIYTGTTGSGTFGPCLYLPSTGQNERFVITFKRSNGKIKDNGPAVDAPRHFSSPTETRGAPHHPMNDPPLTSSVGASAACWIC